MDYDGIMDDFLTLSLRPDDCVHIPESVNKYIILFTLFVWFEFDSLTEARFVSDRHFRPVNFFTKISKNLLRNINERLFVIL